MLIILAFEFGGKEMGTILFCAAPERYEAPSFSIYVFNCYINPYGIKIPLFFFAVKFVFCFVFDSARMLLEACNWHSLFLG